MLLLNYFYLFINRYRFYNRRCLLPTLLALLISVCIWLIYVAPKYPHLDSFDADAYYTHHSIPMGNSSTAIVSLLSTDGIESRLSLKHHLSFALKLSCTMNTFVPRHIDRRLLVVDTWGILTHNDRAMLEAHGWILQPTPCLLSRPSTLWTLITGNRYEHSCLFSKLWLWTFHKLNYSRVIFMDLDMLLVGPIPHAFETNASLAMVPEKWMIGFDSSQSYFYFNAGFMSLQPDPHTYAALSHTLRFPIPFVHLLAEQEFLNLYFKNKIEPLPVGYNVQISSVIQPLVWNTAAQAFISSSSNSNISVLHFIAGNKPWDKAHCHSSGINHLCTVWEQLTC